MGVVAGGAAPEIRARPRRARRSRRISSAQHWFRSGRLSSRSNAGACARIAACSFGGAAAIGATETTATLARDRTDRVRAATPAETPDDAHSYDAFVSLGSSARSRSSSSAAGAHVVGVLPRLTILHARDLLPLGSRVVVGHSVTVTPVQASYSSEPAFSAMEMPFVLLHTSYGVLGERTGPASQRAVTAAPSSSSVTRSMVSVSRRPFSRPRKTVWTGKIRLRFEPWCFAPSGVGVGGGERLCG